MPLHPPFPRQRLYSYWPQATALASIALSIILVVLIWSVIPQGLVTGTDGRLLTSLARQANAVGNFFDTTNYNSLQGGMNLALPFNHMLSVTMPLMFFEAPLARLLTSLYALLLYVAACMIFARAIGVKWLLVPLAVAVPCALQIYPFQYEFGFSNQFLIIPGHYLTVFIFTAVLAIIYTAGESRRDLALRYVLIFFLVLWAVVAEPLFAGLNVLFFVPFGLAILATKGRSIPYHVLFLGVIAALLWVLGPLEYLYTILYGNARTMLNTEFVRGATGVIWGASSLFSGSAALYLHAFIVVSLATGVLTGRLRLRWLAPMTLLILIAFYAVLVYYVVFATEWPFPLPIYFENATIHLFSIVALMCCQSHIEKVAEGESFPRVRRIAGVGSALLVAATVPALLLFYLSDVAPRRTGIYIDNYADAAALSDAITEVWEEGDGEGAGAKGTVAVINIGYDQVRQFSLVLNHLWLDGVPSMNEYSQIVTPPSHLLVSRVAFSTASAPGGNRPGLNRLSISEYNRNLFLLYGVRLVVSGMPLQEESLVLEREVQYGPEGAHRAFIYSIAGFRSPLVPEDARAVENLADVISALNSESFDVRNEAVFYDQLGLGAVAGGVEPSMRLRRNRIFLETGRGANSAIVLPVVFSRCWTLEESDTRASLVRAHGNFLAVLPAGAETVTISSRFSVWRPGCRQNDIADWRADISAVSTAYPLPAGVQATRTEPWKERLRHLLMKARW